MRIAGLLLVAACAYQPSTFYSAEQKFDGQRTSAGCLDLAVARRADVGDHAVVAYAFGNRCESPAVVDLAAARVLGDDALLEAFDPEHVIDSRQLDGHAVGGEAIAYAGKPKELCIDPGSIAHAPADAWVCLGEAP